MRWNADRPSFTAKTMPPRPAVVSTIPAADFATSVAVDTATPICAWRGSIVRTVSAHSNRVTAPLERLHQVILSLGKDTGEDGELLGTHIVRKWARGTDRPVQSYCMSH